MIIGIDFDNTIACYDPVFRKIAGERKIDIPRKENPKRVVREAIRALPEGEWLWSLAQGEVYGPGIMGAHPFPALKETLRRLTNDGHSLRIISHKTAYPNAGEAHSLQDWALHWIEHHLPDCFKPHEIHLCDSKIDKIVTIEHLQCDCFIDDLEEILTDPQFPTTTIPILFAPNPNSGADRKADSLTTVTNWLELPERISKLPFSQPSPRPTTLGKSPIERIQSSLNTTSVLDARPLAGGRNSAVFLLSSDAQALFVAKAYKRLPFDNRDRFRNETAFLEYAATTEPRQTPLLRDASPTEQCAFIEFIPGELASELANPASDWEACLQFYQSLQIKLDSEAAQSLPRAAESALSLQEHLDWISKRRSFWLKQSLAQESESRWKTWIQERLEPAFQFFAKTLICHEDFKARIDPNSFLISPSDFGLHNAIRKFDDSLIFIDFEYGGWDDPAKTLSDFFLQPRLTPPDSLFESWKQAILELLPNDQRAAFERRLPLVRSCCAMKWIYIILKNRLDPETLQPKSADPLSLQALEKLETRLESLQACESD